jgi:hypothetical protein
MRWRKLGLLFAADGQHPWMRTHASNPTAEVLADGNLRVYFSTRDELNRSHVASAVFSLTSGPRLIDLPTVPIVMPGAPGAYDDSGASMGCVVRLEGRLLLYYVGWNLGVTVPWRNSIGLATSEDGGLTFAKLSPAPLLDRHAVDPFSLSYPWVLAEPTRWRMWYGSNLGWGANERDMRHVIKYAESADGLSWVRNGRIAIDHSLPEEFALARPCVIADPGVYRMWFAHRGDRYRIGLAESADGLTWTRLGSSGLDVSAGSGWDSEMVSYPCVFDHRGQRYMLYNGNRYGRTGFGLAVQEA